MLVQRTAENGVVLFRSPVLEAIGVPHGFSTRIGGVSPPPFESLNLGNPNGCAIQDDLTHLDRNYELLLKAAGLAGRRLVRVHQVHADRVVWADAQSDIRHEKADAIATRDPTIAASVRVADCVPVLLASEDGQQVAAVHAGWRGVVAGIVLRAVEAMATTPQRLRAAIGPSIGMEAFEVGPEVLQAFETHGYPAHIRRRPDGKGHVDLRQTLLSQLRQAGVAEHHIDSTDTCTVRDSHLFYSHRRDAGVTGRMAAVIGVRKATN